jgi:hypothetical protein
VLDELRSKPLSPLITTGSLPDVEIPPVPEYEAENADGVIERFDADADIVEGVEIEYVPVPPVDPVILTVVLEDRLSI